MGILPLCLLVLFVIWMTLNLPIGPGVTLYI